MNSVTNFKHSGLLRTVGPNMGSRTWMHCLCQEWEVFIEVARGSGLLQESPITVDLETAFIHSKTTN